MIAYILKRLLLIIPTLLAIMTINFFSDPIGSWRPYRADDG